MYALWEIVLTQTPVPNLLDDPTATRVTAGETEAVFLPGHGMLGISLRRNEIEALRRIDNLIVSAAANQTAGIPFLFPFANRLANFQYEAAGRGVTLSPHSLVLRYDENGLPMHGLMWPHLVWEIVETGPDHLTACLDWSHPKCLSVFPYPCKLTMSAKVEPASLTIETELTPTGDIKAPISFGFHPYFGLDGSRGDWRVSLPEMQHLTVDARQIPTGATTPFPAFDEVLGTRNFDDGFALLQPTATLSVASGSRKISVDLLEGYTHCQVYGPHDHNYIAFEPMTAPANALISGDGLRLIAPGDSFRAKFHIRID